MAGLLTKEESKWLSILSKLVYCNPFTAERVRLERTALGKQFEEAHADWNLDPRAKDRSDNLEKLIAESRTVLERRQAAFLSGKGNEVERELYGDAVFFVVYHDLATSFDAIIDVGEAPEPSRIRVKLYATLLEQLSGYGGTYFMEEAPHLFSCFFQVRRAFHYIFRFFIGKSLAATKLRARLWESIFTYDLRRYRRVLFGRIGRIPTLVTGPSGSGKEVVARAIGLSQYVPFDVEQRRFLSDYGNAFYPINLSALSQTLIESELFGHRKGAFTGALEDRVGYFEACGAYGTVFLDEIGEADESIQVKLLRVLQTRRFQRLGDVRSVAFEGKVVAATNRDLEAAIGEGKFREDFYYRLRSDVVVLPTLKEILCDKGDEILFLGQHVAEQLVGGACPDLVADFARWLKAYPDYNWPGNFRELEQAMRSVLLRGSYEPPQWKGKEGADEGLVEKMADTGWSLKAMTEAYVSELYRRNPNYEAIARDLEVDRRTVKKYVIES